MSDIESLIGGFRNFRNTYLEDSDGRYRGLAEHGPHSRILMIGCCDSRADPAIITNSSAGDLMVIRNMANLVPAFAPDSPFQESQAALEFAVYYLELEHIIVMGHSRCGGVRSLMTRIIDDMEPRRPLDRWMSVAEPAAQQVLQELPQGTLDEQACACSRLALAASLENLRGYPGVAEREQAGSLQLHGWYFNLADGSLEGLRESSGEFAALY